MFPATTISRHHDYCIQAQLRFYSRGFLWTDFASVVINLHMSAFPSSHILRLHPSLHFYNEQKSEWTAYARANSQVCPVIVLTHMKWKALAVSGKHHYSLQQLVCTVNCVRRPSTIRLFSHAINQDFYEQFHEPILSTWPRNGPRDD